MVDEREYIFSHYMQCVEAGFMSQLEAFYRILIIDEDLALTKFEHMSSIYVDIIAAVLETDVKIGEIKPLPFRYLCSYDPINISDEVRSYVNFSVGYTYDFSFNAASDDIIKITNYLRTHSSVFSGFEFNFAAELSDERLTTCILTFKKIK